MADHLKAVDVLKTITIKIMRGGKVRLTLDGIKKDVDKHVSDEYFQKTQYICERYYPEIMEA